MADKFNTLAETAPYGGKYVNKRKEMKADQTQNVKKLMTSDDAYSPEKMYKAYGTKGKIRGVKEVPEGTAGANYFSKLTDYGRSKVRDNERRRKRKPIIKRKSVNTKKINTRPPEDKKKLRRANGGRAVGKNS